MWFVFVIARNDSDDTCTRFAKQIVRSGQCGASVVGQSTLLAMT
jgi:hypothetical protein